MMRADLKLVLLIGGFVAWCAVVICERRAFAADVPELDIEVTP